MTTTSSPPLSALDAALRERRFIITAEVTSPAGPAVETFRRRARALRDSVLAVNVADGQALSAHLPPLAAARLLLDEGLEPVLTLQCRDRNRLALQSELIGAAALGIRNVLCLTGDRPGAARPELQAVFDLDSVGLLQAVASLGDGRLLDGTTFLPPALLVPGAVADPFAASVHQRLDRLQAKVSAGARFVQTQYVFDVEVFDRWLQVLRGLGLSEQVAVLPTIGLAPSRRALDFLLRLPDVHIPEGYLRRFDGLDEPAFAAEALRWCAEAAARLAALPGVAGIHFIAPFREAEIPCLIERAGLAGRTARA